MNEKWVDIQVLNLNHSLLLRSARRPQMGIDVSGLLWRGIVLYNV